MQEPPRIASPIMRQTWSDVAFVHWRTDREQLAPYLPAGVELDEFDGSAWIGLVPFRIDRSSMGGVGLPFGRFAETNVRVYVRDRYGRRGVVFRSLDAAHLAPVAAARAALGLPYVWSRMRVTKRRGVVSYLSRRWSSPRGVPDSVVRVRPLPERADDALSEFLTARYALYETRFGRTIRLPLHHERWPLQRAELVELRDRLVAQSGVYGLHDREPDSVLFSSGVHTEFGAPSRLG